MKRFKFQLQNIKEKYKITDAQLAEYFNISINSVQAMFVGQFPPCAQNVFNALSFASMEDRCDLAARALIQREFPTDAKFPNSEQLVKTIALMIMLKNTKLLKLCIGELDAK